MSFTLPPLPYTSLAPVIDDETLALHHGKHHAGYVKKLNEALEGHPDLASQPLEAILARASVLPAAIRNNGGQHHAHSLYWASMTPGGSSPSGTLEAAIARDFGSLDALKHEFDKAAEAHFGTGWAWLIRTDGGSLAVGTTQDGTTPVMDDAEIQGIPILANDLWEHAWYLQYRNEKARYLAAWWNIVDWTEASRRFAH